MTTTVESRSSLYFLKPVWLGSQGQLHLSSSTLTSPTNLKIATAVAQQIIDAKQRRDGEKDVPEVHVVLCA